MLQETCSRPNVRQTQRQSVCSRDVPNAISKAASTLMPRPWREAVGGGRVLLLEWLLAPDGHWQEGETQLQKTAVSSSKTSEQLNVSYTRKHVSKLIIVHRSM